MKSNELISQAVMYGDSKPYVTALVTLNEETVKAFAKQHGNLDGQIAAFFVMVVAAAEVVVGLAIIMTIFRTRRSASVDDASLLKY